MFDSIVKKELACRDFVRKFEESSVDEMAVFPSLRRHDEFRGEDVIAVRFLVSKIGEVDDFEPTIWFVNPLYWNEYLHQPSYSFHEYKNEDDLYYWKSEDLPTLPSEILPEILTLQKEFFEKLDVIEQYEGFHYLLLTSPVPIVDPEEKFNLFAEEISARLSERENNLKEDRKIASKAMV